MLSVRPLSKTVFWLGVEERIAQAPAPALAGLRVGGGGGGGYTLRQLWPGWASDHQHGGSGGLGPSGDPRGDPSGARRRSLILYWPAAAEIEFALRVEFDTMSLPELASRAGIGKVGRAIS